MRLEYRGRHLSVLAARRSGLVLRNVEIDSGHDPFYGSWMERSNTRCTRSAEARAISSPRGWKVVALQSSPSSAREAPYPAVLERVEPRGRRRKPPDLAELFGVQIACRRGRHQL